MKFECPIGATPLDPDEIDGLIPSHITLQIELNEYEQFNILKAEQWVAERNFHLNNVLEIDFIKKLHFRMFNETWHWAGEYRKTEKNIGVDPFAIVIELKKLLDDILFQVEHSTYSIDEIAARLHHRLVSIHPFANGNGRHARLFADVFLKSLGSEFFSWGDANLAEKGKTRNSYINALRAADKYQYDLLLHFVGVNLFELDLTH